VIAHPAEETLLDRSLFVRYDPSLMTVEQLDEHVRALGIEAVGPD
jgi:hypothetical protein